MAKKPKTPVVQAPAVDPGGYFQQLHRVCGGEIVPAASKTDMMMVCRRCRDTWKFNAGAFGNWPVAIPADWMPFEPEGGAK